MNLPYIRDVLWEWHMRHDPDCLRAFTFRYWNILLAISICSVIGAVLLGAWMMFAPRTAPSEKQLKTTEDSEALSRERLKSVLDTFEQRKLKYEQASTKAPPATDPSL